MADKAQITVRVDPVGGSAEVVISGTVEQRACPDVTRVLWRLKAIFGSKPVTVDFTNIDDPAGTARQTLANVCASLGLRTLGGVPARNVTVITAEHKSVTAARHDRTPA